MSEEEALDNVKEPVAPQSRIDLERRVEAEYKAALVLLKEKHYKQALRKFKWVFANEASSDLFLPSTEIRKLVKNYPPAAAVIKRWRNDKERLVLAQNADLTLVGQWDTLNSCLGEKKRTMEVYFKLEAAGAPEELLHDILNEIWESLARARKYEKLKGYLPTLGFHLLLHSIEFDSAMLFPGHRKQSKKEWQHEIERHIEYLLDKGSMSYEVALGLGEKRAAAVFAKKILGVETSDRAYAILIKSAVRARAYPEALAHFAEAKEKFSLRRLKNSSQAIKAIPGGRPASAKQQRLESPKSRK